ncbi:hypothetical protein BB561_001852 [Smittium simulii]|uniref:Uncharacterized protein n=1 Tax=Smittium simulii TaxID=133385 RepID=A0A2T9YSQ1_9FUNG|nr:hypothetical protein BB561_001852 [Smittium simulii]
MSVDLQLAFVYRIKRFKQLRYYYCILSFLFAGILLIPTFFGEVVFTENNIRVHLKYKNRGGEQIIEIFCKLLPYLIGIGYCLFVTAQIARTLLKKDMDSVMEKIFRTKLLTSSKNKNSVTSNRKVSTFSFNNQTSDIVEPDSVRSSGSFYDEDFKGLTDNIEKISQLPHTFGVSMPVSDLNVHGLPELAKKNSINTSSEKAYRVSMLNYKENLKNAKMLILRLALFPIVPLFTQLYHRIGIYLHGVRISFEIMDNANKSSNIAGIIMFAFLSLQSSLNLTIFLLNPTIMSALKLSFRRIQNVDLDTEKYLVEYMLVNAFESDDSDYDNLSETLHLSSNKKINKKTSGNHNSNRKPKKGKKNKGSKTHSTISGLSGWNYNLTELSSSSTGSEIDMSVFKKKENSKNFKK